MAARAFMAHRQTLPGSYPCYGTSLAIRSTRSCSVVYLLPFASRTLLTLGVEDPTEEFHT